MTDQTTVSGSDAGRQDEQPDSFHLAADGNEAATEQPLYEHDCPDCVFLGRHASTDADFPGNFDLYYHAGPSPLTRTVAARYGRDGEYFSGLPFSQPYVDIAGIQRGGIAPLVEAKRRAIARGLIKGAQS